MADPPLPDEVLGRLVRGVWCRWAREQPDPKPSWLVPWDDLDDGQREVDIRIGRAVAKASAMAERETCAAIVKARYHTADGETAAAVNYTLREILADLLRKDHHG